MDHVYERKGIKRTFFNLYRNSSYFRELHGYDEGAFWSGINDDILDYRNKGYAVIGVGDLNAKIGALPDGAGARVGYKGHDRAGEALSALLVATGLLSMNGKLLWDERQGKGLGRDGVCEGVTPSATSMSDGAAMGALTEIDYVLVGDNDYKSTTRFAVLRLFAEQTGHYWLVFSVANEFLDIPEGISGA
jgi:hypothetical protein